jgi:hypothetical protein
LSPNYDRAHYIWDYLGLFMSCIGRFEESTSSVKWEMRLSH